MRIFIAALAMLRSGVAVSGQHWQDSARRLNAPDSSRNWYTFERYLDPASSERRPDLLYTSLDDVSYEYPEEDGA